jgi:hypothetical protein
MEQMFDGTVGLRIGVTAPRPMNPAIADLW